MVSFIHMPSTNVIPHAFDYYLAASRTIGILQGMTRDISKIYEVQANIFGHFMMSFKCLYRRLGEMHQLIVWMKPEEMNWCIRSQVVIYPST